MITGRRVVLGVSGGIAIYKACTIARQLTEAGGVVDVVMTASATRFVRPVTFEALTGRPVLTSLWERGRALDHVHLARDPDLIVLAPATANLLARVALGIADDFLTSLLLATTGPVLVAPAMNDQMYANPATRRNVETLRERGWVFLGPDVGPLAEGESERPGRMTEPEEIVASAERLLRRQQSALAGKRIVVTAGPTREALDAVRVITNPSSGRMGFAVAAAAYARGAEVVLIAGPTPLVPPSGVRLVWVQSTDELLESVRTHLPQADVLVMAAAPSDYRPAGGRMPGKRPRAEGTFDLTLEPTRDVLKETASDRPAGCVTVGFALEDGRDVVRARAKLADKCLDLVVLNSATDPEAGFAVDTNRVTFVSRETEREFPVLPKAVVAEKILDEVETLL